MLLGNVLSGAAFKAASLSVGFFVAVLLAVGFVLHQLLSAQMFGDLEQLITEEVVLFQDINAQGGQQALIGALSGLSELAINEQRAVALFDSSGKPLSGNVDIAPDFVGWQTQTLDLYSTGNPHNFKLHVAKLDTSTLVVGRSTHLIEAALKKLLMHLLLAGLFVTLVTLVMGFMLSRRTYLKLENMASTLEDLSRGETQKRLPVSQTNDQIDRVSLQINGHLDNLATLMDTTRNTVSSIAHDLRTPLNRAFLQLQQIQANESVQQESATLIENAVKELSTVNEIFDSIVQLSKIESSTSQQTFTTFPVAEVVTDMADIFQPVIESAEQFLTVDVRLAENTLIHGDKRLLRQLLVNLIENAIRHCPPGTTIAIDANQSVNCEVRIEIADNGPGIPEEHLGSVVKPFFRLDASRSTPGTGLGLALVKAVALRHNASLELKDNYPGLRVVITFPAVRPA